MRRIKKQDNLDKGLPVAQPSVFHQSDTGFPTSVSTHPFSLASCC